MGRILVVDDDEAVRRLVGHVLSGAGHTVTEASSGGQALRLLEDSGEFAVLILDLTMGIVSGWRLLEEVDRRDLRRDMRVVVLSGRAGGEEILRGWRLRVDEYCTKPFDTDALLGAIEEVLSASREELASRREDRLRTPEFLALLASGPSSEPSGE